MKHQSIYEAWIWGYMNTLEGDDCSMLTVSGRHVTFTWEHPSTGTDGVMNALCNAKYGAYAMNTLAIKGES